MSNKKNDDADSLVAKSLKPGWERHVPLMSTIVSLIDAVEPLVQAAVTKGSALFAAVPENVVPLVIGLALCFFGGIYTLTIAAVQAFRISGWDSAKTHALELYEEWKPIQEAMKRDAEDPGKSPMPRSASPAHLLLNKVHIFLSTCEHPERLQAAVSGILRGIVAVVAVLQSQFARTCALGASLGKSMETLAVKVVQPRLETSMPAEYKKWAGPMLTYLTQFVAIAIAFFVQRTISAIQSALLGSVMAVNASLILAKKYGLMDANFDTNKANLNESLAYLLAAFGIWWQLSNSFGVPFPLNIITFPLSMMETLLMKLVNA